MEVLTAAAAAIAIITGVAKGASWMLKQAPQRQGVAGHGHVR
jgi:hypothetical protein